jgi:cytochrome c-type biogenesis protein CcmF
VRVYYKPFVGWIWGGAVLMALGGGLALSDRRYALAARKEREARQAVKQTELPSTVARFRGKSTYIRSNSVVKKCCVI